MENRGGCGRLAHAHLRGLDGNPFIENVEQREGVAFARVERVTALGRLAGGKGGRGEGRRSRGRRMCTPRRGQRRSRTTVAVRWLLFAAVRAHALTEPHLDGSRIRLGQTHKGVLHREHRGYAQDGVDQVKDLVTRLHLPSVLERRGSACDAEGRSRRAATHRAQHQEFANDKLDGQKRDHKAKRSDALVRLKRLVRLEKVESAFNRLQGRPLWEGSGCMGGPEAGRDPAATNQRARGRGVGKEGWPPPILSTRWGTVPTQRRATAHLDEVKRAWVPDVHRFHLQQ